jgi:hypothetical protein
MVSISAAILRLTSSFAAGGRLAVAGGLRFDVFASAASDLQILAQLRARKRRDCETALELRALDHRRSGQGDQLH